MLKTIKKLLGFNTKLHRCFIKCGPVPDGQPEFFLRCREAENNILVVETPSHGFMVNYCPLCGYKSKKQPFRRNSKSKS
jgi:hypothetical protein